MNAKTKAAGQYTAEQITVLEGLDPVRKRPGMYIGSTGTEGLHHLIWEVVDNSIDEAMAGFCTEITIELLPDAQISVTDNGRGIPVDIHKQTKVSALETVLTKLHAGGKFGTGGYKVSGGLHGVGVSVVNALSDYMRAEVKRDGKLWMQEYSCGKPKAKAKSVGSAKGTGTTIIFHPDKAIFTTTLEFNWQTILDHLRQQAYLTKGVKLIITDRRSGKKTADTTYAFYFEGGVASYVRHLNHNKEAKHESVFYIAKEYEEKQVEVALQYTDEYKETLFAFANNIYNPEGGTHLIGFRTALTRVLNSYARNKEYLKEKDENLSGEDVREGLTTVISVKLKEPQFEGQTKAKLGNPDVRTAVEAVFGDTFAIFLEEHPRDAEAILSKCILSAQARQAARAARETVLRKGVLEGLTLPGKLADCSSRDSSSTELYIVEGDSAGGCFSGDTKIALTDGRNITFKQLVQEQTNGKKHFCYTVKTDGHIGIAPIENARITKQATEMVKIFLDTNAEIVCTPNHQFMLRDGRYKAAKDLTSADSLMPLRRQVSRLGKRITIKGYEMVFDPRAYRWIFTHLLTDAYNIARSVYGESDGAHRHHKDFNKRNNDPDNLVRLSKTAHLAYHALHAERTIGRPEVKRKLAALRRTPAFRKKIRDAMTTPEMRALLSARAKQQWENVEYKRFMTEKFLAFYASSPTYRAKNNALLKKIQAEYWAHDAHRQLQANRVRSFFTEHPERKQQLSLQATKQWNDKALRRWRSTKTKTQWTAQFRKQRKETYGQTYLNKALRVMKSLIEKNGAIDNERYNDIRRTTGDRSLIRLDTLCKRFFSGDIKKLEEAALHFNHKIKEVIPLQEHMDVYDLEVPETHNFALASGIFVHNSAKQGRNREYQAILPLRGKILNVEKARLDKMLANNELKSLVIALGTNIGEQFDLKSLRYDRIIIMTDADVDGSHIRTLLLTLFYRYFPEIIRQGHLYIAQPPLYRIQRGKEVRYVYNDAEKEKIVAELGKVTKTLKHENTKTPATEERLLEVPLTDETSVTTSGVNIQRYKGLGEMNPEQLWETTMDPVRRLMLRVTIDDAEKADEVFDILMGAEVAPRKKFIQTHAKSVQNLDI